MLKPKGKAVLYYRVPGPKFCKLRSENMANKADAAERGGKKGLSIGARADGGRGEGGGLNSIPWKDAGEGGE